MKQTMGIVGLGAFGRFMARHVSARFDVRGWDRETPSPEMLKADRAETITLSSFEDVCSADVVVFAVPLDGLAEVAGRAASFLKPDALAADVTSVKVKPVAILRETLPEHVDILGTHPLFGPQSGRDGIAGLRIALCPVRISSERYYRVCDWLTRDLRLLVLRVTEEEHDREMAKVQAVTHFMSRALKEVGLEPSLMATKAYEKLQEFSAIVLSDSWDLFLTIQNGNPYAAGMRRKLMDEMRKLETALARDNGGTA